MKTRYDLIPPMVVREGNRTRLFIDFEAVEVPVTGKGEGSKQKTVTKYDGINIDLIGAVDYDCLVDAIISEQYPSEKEFSIIMNERKAQKDPDNEKAAGYLADADTLEIYREHAKEMAKKILTAIASL